MATQNPTNQSNNQSTTGQPQKSLRGFAAMDPARQREIASMGGKAAHESGHAHEFTSEEAREAGRKGGEASHGGRRRNAENSQNAAGRTGSPMVSNGAIGSSGEINARPVVAPDRDRDRDDSSRGTYGNNVPSGSRNIEGNR